MPEGPANGGIAGGNQLLSGSRQCSESEPSVRYGAIKPQSEKGCYTNVEGGAAVMSDIGVRTGAAEMLTDTEPEEEGEPCQWGPFRPTWCQMFRSPKVVLFCFCWAGAIQGMIVNGFLSVVITTIEKRFELASTETGIIASFYDIAAVLCLIPVSYLGGFGRKPRWVATGIMIVGIGSFLFSLPHFTTGLYTYDAQREAPVCHANASATTALTCSVNQAEASAKVRLNSYKYMFIIAQILHGSGATPLFTLGITYMDENLKAKMTPVYVGIFYAMAIIGPAVGYMVGGEFLKRYVDIGAVDVSRLDITPESPMWVGAWWIGFFVSGFIAILISIPIQGFPKVLPGSLKLRAERVSEVYRGSDNVTSQPGFGSSIRDIPVVIKVLFTNPTFMFLNLAGASEAMIVSGFTAFAPKFIEQQFSISAGLAAQLVGLASIPSGGGGTFLGGYLVKRLDLRCPGILKLCLTASFTSLLLILVFLVRCSNSPFAGVNADYGLRNLSSEVVKLNASCNEGCHCQRHQYDPVCGSDRVIYYSPCYAGCRSSIEANKRRVFNNCTCVPNTYRAYDDGTPGGRVVRGGIAHEGKCGSNCEYLTVFLPVFALAIFFTFTTSMPALSATLRCVPEKQRSFALGIQWILVRCLGSIPAPIFFGSLIDMTCQLWHTGCSDRGSCLFYDNATMGHYLLALAICAKGVAFMFFLLALLLYRPPASASALPSCPGDQVSTSSTMQMLPRDRGTHDQTLPVGGASPRSVARGQPATAQTSFKPPTHNKMTKMSYTSSPNVPTGSLTPSTAQAKYKPVPQ